MPSSPFVDFADVDSASRRALRSLRTRSLSILTALASFIDILLPLTRPNTHICISTMTAVYLQHSASSSCISNAHCDPGNGPRLSKIGCGDVEIVGGGGKRCDMKVFIRCKMKAGLSNMPGRR
ncbi:predicted protein [Sclerotinia sclerotiorum 1980 UF-70]|uniref:Uncharacterized protein n=1 Tax=Sclerotinia sclerotiorum (strain ATCC 18683 / 1980 / Ss-1) TaxID=665079 RepID=A7EE79_SCLS1|nr:predicted protein [Sclerotinia sclerotiorum 1980 UF-70]EDO01145.1 predicted protein [Sclerotinia sclerotiorum 1980 UF-70]